MGVISCLDSAYEEKHVYQLAPIFPKFGNLEREASFNLDTNTRDDVGSSIIAGTYLLEKNV